VKEDKTVEILLRAIGEANTEYSEIEREDFLEVSAKGKQKRKKGKFSSGTVLMV